MKTRNHLPLIHCAKRAAVTGLLVTCTLMFAQDSNTDTNGGWKRVGDQSQVYNPPAPPDSEQNPPDANQDPGAPPPQSPANPPMNNGRSQYPPYANRQQPQNYPPPPPVPAQVTMQAGTFLTVRINQMLSSDKNQPGDAFTASLAQPVVANGVVIAEPGQTAAGRVVTADRHHADTPGRLGIQLTNLSLVDGQQVPIATQFVSREGGTTSKGTQVGTVAATTGAGAAIGAIAGWGTGAAIGAGAGAVAGLIGVMVTRNHASVVYPEQILTFRVQAPVTISTANSAQAFRYIQPNEYDRPTFTNYGDAGPYQSGAPAPPVVYNNYAYGYPYYAGFGWGYPYWGPSFAFYGGGWYGGRGYYGGGRGYYGGGRGYYGGGHGYAGGGYHGGGGRR